MALFGPFWWLSSAHCTCVPHLLQPSLCPWTWRLLPCLGYTIIIAMPFISHWETEHSITESLCDTSKTNTTLWINYTSIKKRNRTRRDPKPLLGGICCKEHSWLMGPAATPLDPLSHLHWGHSVPTQLPANDRAQQGCCIWPIPAQGGSLSAWGPSVHQLRLFQKLWSFSLLAVCSVIQTALWFKGAPHLLLCSPHISFHKEFLHLPPACLIASFVLENPHCTEP